MDDVLRVNIHKNYLFLFSNSSNSSSVCSKISIVGSMNSCSFANVLFNVKTNDGSKTRFDNIPKNNVKATNPPKATVPPKLESMKTENPKNKIIEV